MNKKQKITEDLLKEQKSDVMLLMLGGAISRLNANRRTERDVAKDPDIESIMSSIRSQLVLAQKMDKEENKEEAIVVYKEIRKAFN